MSGKNHFQVRIDEAISEMFDDNRGIGSGSHNFRMDQGARCSLVEKRCDARFRIGDVLDVNDQYACRTGAFNRSLYGGESRLGIPQRKLPAGKVIILDVDE